MISAKLMIPAKIPKVNSLILNEAGSDSEMPVKNITLAIKLQECILIHA